MQEIEIDSKKFQFYSIPTPNGVLLAIRGGRGMLACSYLNVSTAEKLGDALALVSGVRTCEDMLVAKVFAISSAAEKLGVEAGMSGRDALLKMY